MTLKDSAIVDAQGRYQFGRYSQPFVSANISDGYVNDYAPWMRQPTRWNTWLRSLRLKEWHFLSVNHTDIFLAFAVAQLGYVANLFAYAVDKRSGQIHEWGRRAFMGGPLRFGDSSIQGQTVWQSRGCDFKILNQPDAWGVELRVDSLSAQFQIMRDEAMALVFPLAQSRAGYTHKEVGNAVRGSIQLSGEQFTLTPENCLGASDWSRSFSNRITEWYFACFAAYDDRGTRIGLNLSGLIYDDATGTSQENTVWIDGRGYKVGAAQFTLPAAQELDRKAWRVEAVDAEQKTRIVIELSFEPIGARREHVSLGFLASKFTQAFGYYSGTITANGHSHRVQRAFGVAEKHYSKW